MSGKYRRSRVRSESISDALHSVVFYVSVGRGGFGSASLPLQTGIDKSASFGYRASEIPHPVFLAGEVADTKCVVSCRELNQ